MQSLRNTSTISRLPDDALLYIFELVEQDKDSDLEGPAEAASVRVDPRRLYALLFVCRRWHNIIMTCPSLWAYIDNRWGSGTNTLLQLSCLTPLSLVWDEHRPHPIDDSILGGVFEFHASRLQDVVLVVQGATYKKITDLFPDSFPSLRSFTVRFNTVSGAGGSRSLSGHLRLSHAPRLLSLNLYNIVVPDIRELRVPSLTHLTLDPSITEITPLTLCDFLIFLSNTPSIQSITLKLLSCMLPLGDKPKNLVTLSSLHTLDLRFTKASVSFHAFGTWIILPDPPKSLRLHYEIFNPWQLGMKTEEALSVLHPYSAEDLHPHTLHINCDTRRNYIVFKVDTMLESSRVEFVSLRLNYPQARYFNWFFPHFEEDVDNSETLANYILAFDAHVCNLSTLRALYVEDAYFSINGWLEAFSDCDRLVKVELNVPSARSFLEAMDKAHSPLHEHCSQFLPSLGTLCIFSDSRSHHEWPKVLPLGASALSARAKATDTRLHKLLLQRRPDSDDDDESGSVWDDLEYTDEMDTIKEVVEEVLLSD